MWDRLLSSTMFLYLKGLISFLPKKGLYSQSYGFSSSHVQMWELDRKEGWALKNQCFWIVVLEKTLERPLDCKEIKPVRPKGNHPWIFTERAYAKTSASILWPPDGEGITHWEGPWCWERLKAGREGVTVDEWLDGIIDTMNMDLRKLRETVKARNVWRAAVCVVPKSWTQLSYWTAIFLAIPVLSTYSVSTKWCL